VVWRNKIAFKISLLDFTTNEQRESRSTRIANGQNASKREVHTRAWRDTAISVMYFDQVPAVTSKQLDPNGFTSINPIHPIAKKHRFDPPKCKKHPIQ